MSALVDFVLTQTDPLSGVLLLGVLLYVRRIERALTGEIDNVRERVKRLEGQYLSTDGDDSTNQND